MLTYKKPSTQPRLHISMALEKGRANEDLRCPVYNVQESQELLSKLSNSTCALKIDKSLLNHLQHKQTTAKIITGWALQIEPTCNPEA